MRILFIGSFLGKHRGTKGVAEKLAILLGEDYEFVFASDSPYKVIRLVHILWMVCFSRYQVVHCDIFSGHSFGVGNVTARVAVWRNKKAILNLQGGRLVESLSESLGRRNSLVRWKRAGVKLISPSRFLSSEIQSRWGICVEVIPNFIDLNAFSYQGQERQGQRLLWVRAFREVYHPELAIQALAILARRYEDIRLTMVGPDGGGMDLAIRLSEQLGIADRIDIVGPVPNEELAGYYHSHDLYLNTTAYESFGVAVMEAAACGIPIVSTSVGELPFIWTDSHDILFSQEMTPEAFAEAVSTLFDNRKLMKELQVAALATVKAYDWPSIKPLWKQLLKPRSGGKSRHP